MHTNIDSNNTHTALAYFNTPRQAHTHTLTDKHTHTHSQTSTHTHTHRQTHTHTLTDKHTHTHTPSPRKKRYANGIICSIHYGWSLKKARAHSHTHTHTHRHTSPHPHKRWAYHFYRVLTSPLLMTFLLLYRLSKIPSFIY